MARIACVIAPGIPHHVTQRGNRSQQIFFCDDDYQEYLALMAEWTGRPLGSDPFVHQLEGELLRPLRPRKPGTKPGAREG